MCFWWKSQALLNDGTAIVLPLGSTGRLKGWGSRPWDPGFYGLGLLFGSQFCVLLARLSVGEQAVQ